MSPSCARTYRDQLAHLRLLNIFSVGNYSRIGIDEIEGILVYSLFVPKKLAGHTVQLP